MNQKKILIVDDIRLNRIIISDIIKCAFGQKYEIIEASNGLEGIGLLTSCLSEISW